MTKEEALKKKADRYADYWANHYDKKSKADMSFLRKHVFEAFLEVIKESKKQSPEEVSEGYEASYYKQEVADACKEALEQPAQEPVGVVSWHEGTVMGSIFPSSNMPKDGDLIYTHPHQWQGLTDDDIEKIVDCPVDVLYSGDYEIYRAIESKLKEKNT